jgi:uncharacterized protein YifN (PemK superfamily)
MNWPNLTHYLYKKVSNLNYYKGPWNPKMVFKKPVVVAMQKDGGKLNMKYIKTGYVT